MDAALSALVEQVRSALQELLSTSVQSFRWYLFMISAAIVNASSRPWHPTAMRSDNSFCRSFSISSSSLNEPTQLSKPRREHTSWSPGITVSVPTSEMHAVRCAGTYLSPSSPRRNESAHAATGSGVIGTPDLTAGFRDASE